MYIIVAPIQIKEAFKDQYTKGMLENAQGRSTTNLAA